VEIEVDLAMWEGNRWVIHVDIRDNRGFSGNGLQVEKI
jgi:hypothetical protein